MLEFAIIALVISLIAGALGFSGVAAGARTIAMIIFGLFLTFAVVLFLLLLLGIGAVT